MTTIRETIAQLHAVAARIPDGADGELEIWLCEGETMLTTRLFEIDHAATFSKDSAEPTELYGIVRVEAHRDPTARRLAAPAHNVDGELRQLGDEDDGAQGS